MKRDYDMTVRGAAAEETRTAILHATASLGERKPLASTTLADVAAEAGVSVQTVIRHFGGRDQLFEATMAFVHTRIRAERSSPPGDVETAMRVLSSHYEARGDGIMLMLGQESHDPLASTITGAGRAEHRAWCHTVFSPYLNDSEEVLDLLVVATDVYTWKILRRDRQLSQARTEAQMLRLVRAILDRIEDWT